MLQSRGMPSDYFYIQQDLVSLFKVSILRRLLL